MYSEDWKRDADADAFWTLVDLGKEDLEAFRDALRALERRALIRFAWMYEERASRLGQPRFQRHTAPDLSEDAYDDLARWVVEQGRDYYEHVVNHPAEMPSDLEEGIPRPRLYYEADNIFEELFGEDLPPYGYDY